MGDIAVPILGERPSDVSSSEASSFRTDANAGQTFVSALHAAVN